MTQTPLPQTSGSESVEMTHTTIEQSAEHQKDAQPRTKKPLRFKIGIGLLILYPFLYLIIPIAPFLPLSAGFKVGVGAAVLGAAEVIFLIGVACVGKEAYHAIKAKLGLGKRKKRAADESAGNESPDDPTAPEEERA